MTKEKDFGIPILTPVEKTKQKIKIEISREDGKTFLSFEIDEFLEAVFKKQSSEVRTSVNWKGLNFYYSSDLLSNQNYRNLLREFNLVNDYGTSLYASNYFNIAFLRTVGGKGKILLHNDIPFATVSDGMRRIISFVKRYYEDFLKDYRVKGFLTFEI